MENTIRVEYFIEYFNSSWGKWASSPNFIRSNDYNVVKKEYNDFIDKFPTFKFRLGKKTISETTELLEVK